MAAQKSKNQKRSLIGVQVKVDWLLAATRSRYGLRHPAMLKSPCEVNQTFLRGREIFMLDFTFHTRFVIPRRRREHQAEQLWFECYVQCQRKPLSLPQRPRMK